MQEIILLTGATGYIGRKILDAISNIRPDSLIRITTRNQDFINKYKNQKNLELIYTDDLFTESESSLLNLCSNVGYVIHAAWYVEPGKYLNDIKNIDCMAGTLRLAKAASMANVKKFIGLGTCFEYDIKEMLLSINSPTKPHTFYGHIKLNTFKILESMFVTSKVEFLWCRLFYIYGEGDDERRLSGYIESCIKKNQPAYLSHGMQIRDYLDVQKVAEKIVKHSFDSSVGVRNICSSIPISIGDLSRKIASSQNCEHLLKFAHKNNQVEPEVDCVLGIQETTKMQIALKKIRLKIMIVLKRYKTT